jgi:Zn-dependent peptidase ImmA (M78 family)
MSTITIQPQVFRWLCVSSGWTPDEISARIAEPVDLVQRWCEGTESPSLTINNLEKLSESFKRPLTAFLLPSPPEDEVLPKDFRKIPNAKGDFSKETLRMIRKARRELGLWRELSDNIGESAAVRLPRYSLQDDPETVALMERERLKVSPVPVWSGEYEAYRYWRELLSSLHILVLQLKMPREEARGFSIVDDGYAAVVVNGREAPHARIFTLFHEYAHLLLDEIVICNNQSETSSNSFIRTVEGWCNTFAGAFLLPQEEFERYGRIQKYLQVGDFLNAATAMSSHFRVSKDAALIRLRVLHLISEEELGRLRLIIQSTGTNSKKGVSSLNQGENLTSPDKKISVNPVIQCISEKGSPFVSLVLKNEAAGKITYRDVTDYLDLKSKHIDKLKQRGLSD